ncbi:MAG: PqqD family protein [Desulfobaccales bacterium]
MTLSMQMRVTLPKNVLVRTFETESVLLNLDTECYHGLDDVGSRMCQALTSSENIEAAYQKLLADYEVDPSQLRQDLSDFVAKMVERGLLEVHEN